MKPLKIRFIGGSGFISKAIEYVTFSDWSHVEFELEDGTFLGAHAGDGVQIRPANYCSPAKDRRYAIWVEDFQYDRIMAYAKSKIGTKYNYSDILGLFIHKNLSTPNSLICSMYVFESCFVGALQLLNVLPEAGNRVTPETLHLSPYLIGRMYFNDGKTFPNALVEPDSAHGLFV